MTLTRLFALLTLATLALPGIALGVTPEDVVQTSKNLSALRLDITRSVPAEGQQLTRPSFDAHFTEGRFFPIVRDDGRIAGLIFEGTGEVEFKPPEGLERSGWDQFTEGLSPTMPFAAAHLRFTDGTLFELQGDLEWSKDKDPAGTNFRAFQARSELLNHPRWSRWNPHLVTDQLLDLLGEGHVGGHLLAEFRPVGGGAKSWISALENPRGALLLHEPSALFQIHVDGGSPPEVNILSSWGESPHTQMPFDVTSTSIDITFPPRKGISGTIVEAKAKAELEIVSLGTQGPLKGLVLELESELLLCNARSDMDGIKLTRMVDGAGNKLGAARQGNRLFIRLAEPLPRGEAVKLTIEYAGPMTEGSRGNIYRQIGPWAWYPRNIHPDRFASRVEVHMPRLMRAVAPGDLIEERKEKDGWHFVFAEPSGVANLTLVVGDMVRTADDQQGSSPRIITWLPDDQEKELKDLVQSSRNVVDFISALWGPYPYSTIHIVSPPSYPYQNWRLEGGNAGSWRCVAPGQLQPWQGWADTPSGMVLNPSPTTAPSHTIVEAEALDRLFVDPHNVHLYTLVTGAARQWWGHMVPAQSPRDRWITEALAAWTGTLYVRADHGRDAFAERLETQRLLMNDGALRSAPMARGTLLGREFGPQAWGRGPLTFLWLADRLGVRVFLNALNGLINRSSGSGISLALLQESVAAHSDSSIAEQLARYAEYNDLPTVEYTSSIDKQTGEVVIVFKQTQGSFLPADIPIEFVLNRKEREHSFAFLSSPLTVYRFTPSKPPKRVIVDPTGSAMVGSLKKVKGLLDEIPESPDSPDAPEPE